MSVGGVQYVTNDGGEWTVQFSSVYFGDNETRKQTADEELIKA